MQEIFNEQVDFQRSFLKVSWLALLVGCPVEAVCELRVRAKGRGEFQRRLLLC